MTVLFRYRVLLGNPPKGLVRNAIQCVLCWFGGERAANGTSPQGGQGPARYRSRD